MVDHTFPDNKLPTDSGGNVTSLGLEEETFYPVDSVGTEVTTSTGSEQALYLPDDVGCNYCLIQFKNSTLSTYDPSDDCSGFGFSSSTGGPIFLYDPVGKIIAVSKNKGALLGYYTAPSGKDIVCSVIK